MSSIEEATKIDKILTRECLVDNKYLSDVIFKLADGEEMLAHKLFLITSSSIFHKQISEHTEGVITLNVEWISKPTMLEVCRFIYTDNFNISVLNMMEIWSVALKFEMKFLLAKTFDFICKNLNEKNVFQVLKTNFNHNVFRLNVKCIEFIKNNTEMFLETEETLPMYLYATIQSLVPNLAKENKKVENEFNLLATKIGQYPDQQLSDVQNEQPKLLKHLIFDGEIKYVIDFNFGLRLRIMSKDVLIKEIHFIQDPSITDEEFEIQIMDGNGFEHLKTKEKVSVKDGKIVGKFVRYVLPKETKIFKANKGYIFIIIFKERKERQCYAVSKVSPDSCQDRIKLTYNVRRNIISKIVFEDA